MSDPREVSRRILEALSEPEPENEDTLYDIHDEQHRYRADPSCHLCKHETEGHGHDPASDHPTCPTCVLDAERDAEQERDERCNVCGLTAEMHSSAHTADEIAASVREGTTPADDELVDERFVPEDRYGDESVEHFVSRTDEGYVEHDARMIEPDQFPYIGVSEHRHDCWMVFCDLCDRQVGADQPTRERANELADAHDSAHFPKAVST